MTIWILVSVMLLSLAALGYRQGAIRVSFSLIGIIVSRCWPGRCQICPADAAARGHFMTRTVIWMLSPVIVFGFCDPVQVRGVFVHRKVEYIFKYKGKMALQLIPVEPAEMPVSAFVSVR